MAEPESAQAELSVRDKAREAMHILNLERYGIDAVDEQYLGTLSDAQCALIVENFRAS
jgi:Holliday junction resolvasome RuvABC ATP-dependent DNA helicase subunit